MILITTVMLVGLPLAESSRADLVDVVNQVSLASYQNYLNNALYTHAGDNRGLGGAQHDLARENIVSLFTSFGLLVTSQPFDYAGATYYNIVGTRVGTVRPDEIYIVGAHYDSVGNPGADDNASGVAAVLEAARVLSDESLESTVTFIAFDREEQGLIGSTAYAQLHQADDIRGMISLDMIAYNPAANHDQAWIYWRQDNTAITQELADALLAYGNGVVGTIAQLPYDASDSVPFDYIGKNAALLTEYNIWSNPNYHSAADALETPDYIDYAYATNITRGVVGYLAQNSISAVPEPSTLVLLAVVGLPACVMAARRRGRHWRAQEQTQHQPEVVNAGLP